MELSPLVLTPPLNVRLIRSVDDLHLLRDFFVRARVFGWDIETTPLKDFFWRRCRTIQFGTTTEQYVVDLLAFCNGDPDLLGRVQGHYGLNVDLAPDLVELLDTIREPLCSDQWLKVGVNLGFEYQNFYWLFGIRPYHFFDCSLIERVIWAGAHSLKDYPFYSMESLCARYLWVQIEKHLQESFTLECELTQAQVEYAALDTRLPLTIQAIQMLILRGETVEKLKAKGSANVKYLERVPGIVLGDNLVEIAQVENDAIGAFQDMFVHGDRIDTAKWIARVEKRKEQLIGVIRDELDPLFLPIVGSKRDNISDELIATAEAKWKTLTKASDEEVALRPLFRAAKKANDVLRLRELEIQESQIEVARKELKDLLKAEHSKLKKRRTAIKNLAADCEGEALINYSSNAQMLKLFRGMRGLSAMEDTDDDTLELIDHPAIIAFRRYRKLSKEIGTYGVQWATTWVTKPGKEEGWLHPGDGRLHSVFNQLDAETGRSTSERPNGQNVPKDKETRSCFIADPPDESIRISCCCDVEAVFEQHMKDSFWTCPQCNTACGTVAEEYVLVTADMSGAELRIIAELADDSVWIGAFARGEDVHSVGTEIMYPEEWPAAQLPDCAYFAVKPNGEYARQKCECQQHKEMRDGNKSTNFLIAYGGGPPTLALRIKKTLAVARQLMRLHQLKFPRIWAYLASAGQKAKILKKAFDMFGRRRLFPEPTRETATQYAKEDREETLRYHANAEAAREWFTKRMKRDPNNRELADIKTIEDEVVKFIAANGRRPKGKIAELDSEYYGITHRAPTAGEVNRAVAAMYGMMERQGKNHGIQGTNATIAKLAMGCGYCRDGKPFLWHTLPQYKARLIKFVHDELVVCCPKRYAEKVAALIGDAFKRAAAEKMTKVVMEFEYHVAFCWTK